MPWKTCCKNDFEVFTYLILIELPYAAQQVWFSSQMIQHHNDVLSPNGLMAWVAVVFEKSSNATMKEQTVLIMKLADE